MKILLVTVLVCLEYRGTTGHGMMLQPPSRSSRWRFDKTALINNDDNGLNCGGFANQFEGNGGKCGICGDPYQQPTPRDNENNGKFGDGVVVATYEPGSIIETHVNITANHLGYFYFDICILEDPTKPEPGEECFEPVFLSNGEAKVDVYALDTYFVNNLQLPNITCDRCSLRWTYRAGNNWGQCDDGTQAMGCGNQEHFKGCADIALLSNTVL